jgi:hypothetical protein
MNTNNPQSKSNQKRGPTTGNAGTPSKRNAFMDAKSTSSSEKSKLATMVTDALEMRGRGMKPYVNPALEGLHSNTGPKTNPTSNGSRLSSKYKKPTTKG